MRSSTAQIDCPSVTAESVNVDDVAKLSGQTEQRRFVLLAWRASEVS